MDPDYIWSVIHDNISVLRKDPEDEEIRTELVDLLESLARWIKLGGAIPKALARGER